MSGSNCCFFICFLTSQEVSKVVWYSHLFKNFPQFVVIHIVKGFSIVNEADIDVFFWSWKFLVHVLLKPGLENFEHYFASMWDECNCGVLWTFFDIAFLLGWGKKLTFSSPVAPAQFSKFASILSAALSQHHLLGFEINKSAGSPSPLLAFSIVMLPKAHLTSHSRMSGSRWVITPSLLSGSWRSFLHSSSVFSPSLHNIFYFS